MEPDLIARQWVAFREGSVMGEVRIRDWSLCIHS